MLLFKIKLNSKQTGAFLAGDNLKEREPHQNLRAIF